MSATAGSRPAATLWWLAAAGAALVALLPLLGLVVGAGAASAPGEALDLRELLARARALPLLMSTLALALGVTASALALGGWLAWVEQRASYPGACALALLGLLPFAIPSYVLAGALRDALGPGGLLGGPLGLPRFTGLGAAWLVLTLATVPYVQLLVGAALARTPGEELEAARTLGAGRWRTFRDVVLPRLRPALGLGGALTSLYVVSDFGAVAVLDCPVLTWKLYQAVDAQRLDQALTLGGATLAATLPLLSLARLAQGRLALGRGTVANPRPPARRGLPPALLAATYALHALVIGLGVLLPVVTLAGWTLSGALRGEGFDPIGPALRDTAWIALAGAALTVTLALAPAWVSARSRGLGAGLLEQAIYLTSALPGVLLAFGLLLAALALARRSADSRAVYAALIGGGSLLLLGYGARFLAEAFAALKTAALALDPRLEETARTLGASAPRRWRAITLPALAPGVAAATVLVALAIVKELPVTLLLGGAAGLRPLSARMYDRHADAFLPDAGLAGLLLVALALGTVLVGARWRRHV